MKILFAAAEAAPFIKTGGLADVAGSLPKALKKLGQDVRVVLPLHRQIPEKEIRQMHKIHEFYVDIGWKHEYCGVLELVHDGVTFYFLDNKYYFWREGPYGQFDDGERYIFFSKAVCRLPKILNWKVDIIHANDWHTGLVPVYVCDYRKGDTFYQDVRTLFTIHNLQYQGQFDLSLFYWTNLSSTYCGDYELKFYDSINFMKGAIVYADWVNTVSPTYAREIRYPFFACGLQDVIHAFEGKITGILNGIDDKIWNPQKDPKIFCRYDSSHPSSRAINKKALQEKYGLPVRPDLPLISIVSRLTSQKGMDLIAYISEEMMKRDLQLVVLGTGDSSYEQMFLDLARKHPDKCASRIYFNDDQSRQIYSAADLFLMPSVYEPCGLSQMVAMRYGAIPIVRETGGLRDSVEAYNKYERTGDGFSFAHINADDLLHVLDEATDLYNNQKDQFRNLQVRAMNKDFSWKASSRAYLDLYQSLKA